MSGASTSLLANAAAQLVLFAVASAASPPAEQGTGSAPLAGVDQPGDATGTFPIWPGSGVPPGSESWTWHELAGRGVTAFVLRYRLAHTPESDPEMLAFLQDLMKVLPRQARTEEEPPVGDETSEAARAWAEEDGLQAMRFVRRNASR